MENWKQYLAYVGEKIALLVQLLNHIALTRLILCSKKKKKNTESSFSKFHHISQV